MAIKFNEETTEVIQEESLDSSNGKTKNKKKKDKFKRPAREKWSIFFLVMTIVLTIYVSFYLATPIICALFGGIGWIIWFLIVFVVTACTIGLIWLSDGWKEFNKAFKSVNENFFNASTKVSDFLLAAFPYIVGFGFGFIIASLLICIINIKKGNVKGFKSRLIVTSICALIFITMFIVDLCVYPKIK